MALINFSSGVNRQDGNTTMSNIPINRLSTGLSEKKCFCNAEKLNILPQESVEQTDDREILLKQKELALKEKELSLKEKELGLRERELTLKENSFSSNKKLNYQYVDPFPFSWRSKSSV